MDATEQAALVVRGDVSAVELVDAAVARIEATNGPLNAVAIEWFDTGHGAERRAPRSAFRWCADAREGSLVARGRPGPHQRESGASSRAPEGHNWVLAQFAKVLDAVSYAQALIAVSDFRRSTLSSWRSRSLAAGTVPASRSASSSWPTTGGRTCSCRWHRSWRRRSPGTTFTQARPGHHANQRTRSHQGTAPAVFSRLCTRQDPLMNGRSRRGNERDSDGDHAV